MACWLSALFPPFDFALIGDPSIARALQIIQNASAHKPLRFRPRARLGCGQGRLTPHLERTGTAVTQIEVIRRVSRAQKGDTPAPPSAIEDFVNELKGCGSDALAAVMGAANDALGYLLAFPRFGTDCFIWAVTFVRDLPALGKNVFNGNQKTLDELTSLCE